MTFLPIIFHPYYKLINVLSHFLTSVCNSKETVGVCLSCQLIEIGTFTNQLPDDVDMLLRDLFTAEPFSMSERMTSL